MKSMKKTIALLVAISMIFGCVVGGTIAWLTANSNTVTNTFTTSDVTIKLDESTGTEYKMVPGATIKKDPKVTVVKGSEACYLFVKIEEENRAADATYNYFDYAVASGWTALDGVTGVYYRTVADLTATTADNQEYPVLVDNKVTISQNVTKADMTDAKTNVPKLKFTAYAVQSANLTDQNTDGNVDAKDAWLLAPNATV